MEHAVLKDFPVGCADDSLKLLIGRIISCKTISLIFGCGFNFEKEQSKNTTFVLNSPFGFFNISVQRCLTFTTYCIDKDYFLLASFSSYFWRVYVAPRTIGWTLFPILNLLFLLFSFYFWDKMWRIFKYIESAGTCLVGIPKELNLCNPVRVSSVFMCLTPLEVVSYQLKSHSCWSLIND